MRKIFMAITLPLFFLIPSCKSTKITAPAPDVKNLELQGRNKKTTAVFNYIRDNFGEHIISAQQ